MREMKDSGLPWIGEIPKEWKKHSFKYAGIFVKGKLPQSTNNECKGLPIIGASEMLGKECRQYSLDTNIPLLSNTDIAILWDGANAGITASNLEGIVSSTVVKYSCTNNKFDTQFIAYLFKSAESYFKEKVNGTTIPHMSMNYINSYPLLQPSLFEQQRIATFLDEKCKEIDALIALQEEMITELQAYKQSVISEAVTKGLNPKVTMKDSGVEWIGEIPEHWGLMRLNELGSYRKGPFGSALKISMFVPKSSDTIKVYEQQNAIKKNWQLGSAYISNEYYYNVMQNFTVIPGDLIVSCAGTIGEIYEIPCAAEKGIINQALMRMRMKRNILNINFFIHIFNVSIKNVSDVSSNGSAIKNIPPFNVLKKIKVPIPSIMEQDQIIDYLDTQCTRIDSLIALKRAKIESLKEYKKSVIYEYVTGKKEVPATV